MSIMGLSTHSFAAIITVAILAFGIQAYGAGDTGGTWAGEILTRRSAHEIPSAPSLEVVKQSYISQPGIRKSILQTPLQILDTKYEKGISTYASSEIVVRLPGPGHTFQADVGIDNNMQTARSKGTAIFSIEVGGKEVFKSGVMRASDAPKPVKIDLKGARKFVLKVSDNNDGPEYDIADWANAQVSLRNGDTMWLDEFKVVLEPAKISAGIPFSFNYDGKPSSELLPRWKQNETSSRADGREIHTVTYTDPDTGLEVKYEAAVFDGFPAVDWVVYFRNTGTSDTPIIENIRAMDMQVDAPAEGDIIFHHSHGSTAAIDFMPIDDPMAPKSEFHLRPEDGRSSDTTLPFFNMQWPGGGVIGAIGWTGQWSMFAGRDGGSRLTLQAGQETTHLKLHPGEIIRTPRMLLLAWRGNDSITGHNQFRKLLVTHYLPKISGKTVLPFLTYNSWFYLGANGSNEENQLDLIREASKLGVECYWLDAGWFEGGWSQGAGSWYPKKDAFPNGLKPLGDAAHKAGLKFVLWFEPERVCPGTQIDTEHPEWVMHVLPGDEKPGIQDLNENKLFRLGDPEARKWLTDLISKGIEDWGVDVYRQDYNIFGSTYFWKADDAPDRQGVSENMHIQGLYAMWDDLLKRHPGLVIDNCASGGRRIDLEMISRSIAMWRSDSQCCGQPMPIQDQVQTSGLCLYVPTNSAALWSFDHYEWRSVATTGGNLSMDYRTPGFDEKAAKRAIAEAKDLRPYWTGDYYPLVKISSDEAQWCAWQFDRPDLGAGFAMYFRRPKCGYIAMESNLRGLDPKAVYEVSFPDSGKKETMTGEELVKMPVMIRDLPGSLLVKYRKKTD